MQNSTENFKYVWLVFRSREFGQRSFCRQPRQGRKVDIYRRCRASEKPGFWIRMNLELVRSISC